MLEQKDQGLNVGRRAEQLLNTALSKDFEDKFGGFNYADYGQPGFGMKDVDYVLKQGGSLEDIRRLSYAARDKGLNIGPRTQLLLEQEFGQRPNPEPVKTEEKVQPFSEYDFASKGGKGFGMADIDYLTKAEQAKDNFGISAIELLKKVSKLVEELDDCFKKEVKEAEKTLATLIMALTAEKALV